MAFDISIQHPFRPLVDALKRLKISDNDVPKAAWNLLNEWLWTTLCLQYKPHYIAAASLSVAAKLLNYKLPMREGKAWWLQYDVSPKRLEEVTQQMLRYLKHERKRKVPPVPGNVMKPDATCQSAESCIHSELTMGSDLKQMEVASAAGRLLKPSLNKSLLNKTTQDNHRVVHEASGYQSSDCCSGISGVVNSDNVHPSCKVAHVDVTSGKIDVDRLKRVFERARHLKCAKNKAVVVAESELDSDLFIE